MVICSLNVYDYFCSHMFKSFIKYIFPLIVFLFGGLSELYAHLNDDYTSIVNIQFVINNNNHRGETAYMYTTPVQEGKHGISHSDFIATESELELEEDENAGSKKYLEISEYFSAFDLLPQIYPDYFFTDNQSYYKRFAYTILTPSLYLLIEVFRL